MLKFPINYTLFLLLLALSVQAQPAVMDSLWNVYSQAKNSREEADALSQISSIYLYTNPDSAAILLEEIKDLGELTDYKKILSEYYKQKSIIYLQRANNDQALSYIDTSLHFARLAGDSNKVAANLLNQAAIFEQNAAFQKAMMGLNQVIKMTVGENGNLPLHSKALNNTGIILMRLGLQKEALEYFLQSLDIKSKLHDKQGLAVTYGLISNLHTEREQHEKALEYVTEALKWAKEADSKFHIGAYSLNMSEVYSKLGQKEKTDSLLATAEKIAEDIGHKFLLMHIHINQGERAIEKGLFEQAEQKLSDILSFAQSNDFKFGEGKALLKLAELEEKKKNLSRAVDYASESLEVFSKNNFVEEIPKVQKKLAEFYEQRGQNDEALFMYKAYQTHQDSMFSEKNNLIIEGLKAKHEVELSEKNYELKITNTQRELGQAEAKANKWFLIAMGIVSLFLLAILVMTYHSLSQQRKAKEELTKSNKELYEANEKLEIAYLDLASSNQQLNIANDKLQQFAFAASHDLKESLRNITAYSQLIAKKIQSTADSNKIKYYLEQIIRGGKNMYRLLEDLLKFTDDPSHNQQNEEIDIRETIDTIQSVWSNKNSESDIIHFSYHGVFPSLIASRPLIEQVFTNLIENAIKFRKSQVPLIIDVGVLQEENRRIFYVKDNGIGIEKEYHEQVFDPFFRLYGRHISGSGMGLAIAKRIVENYQGTIWLESNPDEGTTIYFTLPAAVYAATKLKQSTV